MAKAAKISVSLDTVLIENLHSDDKAFLERTIVEKLQKIDQAKADLKVYNDTYKDKIKRLKRHVSDMVNAVKTKDISNLDCKYGQEWREDLSQCES